jgi:hypothetical protein
MRTLQTEAASPCCVLNLLRVRDAEDEDGGTGSMIVVAMVLEAGAEPCCAIRPNAGGEPLETWLRQRTAMSSI